MVLWNLSLFFLADLSSISLSFPLSLALRTLGTQYSLQNSRNKHYVNNMFLKSFGIVCPDWLQSQFVENPLH